MKTVFKCDLFPANREKFHANDFVANLPPGARILSAGFQAPDFVVWAEVDSEVKDTEAVLVHIAGTGHALPEDRMLAFLNRIDAQGNYGQDLRFHAFLPVKTDG